MVTTHSTQWYQSPAVANDHWTTRLADPTTFRTFTASKVIPQGISDLLWRALTAVLGTVLSTGTEVAPPRGPWDSPTIWSRVGRPHPRFRS